MEKIRRPSTRSLPRCLIEVTAAALLAASCTSPSSGDDLRSRPHQANASLDWRDQVIYQVLTDRFSDGDTANNFNVTLGHPGRYHGGDWQGLINKLDYLQTLGVTTLWISPVVSNTEEDVGFASYHGYWAWDFLRPNIHFGDLYKLRELVDKAHERGMYVILDIVTNHVGQLFYYDINNNGMADEWLSGAGTSHTCVQVCGIDPPPESKACSEGEKIYCTKGHRYLERILEWDPDYDPRQVQGWSAVGYNGPATIRFPNWPQYNRMVPPRPPDFINWPANKPWFDHPDWYNRRGRVYLWWHESRDGYPNEFIREQETLGDFPGGLKDLNTDNPDVQEALITAFKYWIDVADFDGFRIDTLKHMDRPDRDLNERGFMGEFATRIRQHAKAIGKRNFFMFGEAFDGKDSVAAPYTFPGVDARGPFQRIDSVFYFSHKYLLDGVFKSGAPTTNIACAYHRRMGTQGPAECGPQTTPLYYDQPHATPEEGGIGLAPNRVLINFLDNHDVPRFLFDRNHAEGVKALHNSLFFLFTYDGIPCVYYGTEQQYAGGTDPRNREDMFLGNPERGLAPWDTSNETYRYLQKLIELRKKNPALRRGDVEFRWTTSRGPGERDSGILAFERVSSDQRVLVVLNTSDSGESTTCAPQSAGGACMLTGFAPGTRLIDIAPGATDAFTVGAGGALSVPVPARGGRVLVPQ